MNKLKLSTVLTVIGSLSVIAALWIMFLTNREEPRYFYFLVGISCLIALIAALSRNAPKS